MATVGEAVIGLKFDDKGIKSSLNKASNQIGAKGAESGKFFGNALTVAAGNVISKGLSTVFSKISSGLDTAIARVDTLKNADKVFTAMGYSAEATSKSMDTLNNYLDGLPTSMTVAVRSVQSLSASFGGIEKGTEAFIDMNNAGLAFGATSEQIESAIMQLGQLSLDGPLDAATWNSLRNDGFSPVFAAMAKEAGISVGELKEQFGGNGTKTVGDFLNELHKLSTQGGGDMESLASLARKNTEGIGTAIENLQNRIGKAIAKVIDHIGSEKIAGIINNVSSHLSDLADVVIGIFDFIEQNWGIISPILSILTKIAGAIIAINVALKAYHKIQTAVNAVQKVFKGTLIKITSGVNGISKTLKKSPIGSTAIKIGDVFSKLAEMIKNAVAKIGEVLSKLADTIKTAITKVGNILSSLAKAIVEPLKIAFKGLGEAIAGFFTAMADPAILVGALMFAAAAASIAAAIWLIGSAVGAIMPVLIDLLNNIIMPIANFIVSTVLNLISALTNAIILLTNQAFIPLGTFLADTFNNILQTVSNTVINLTQGAIIPLIDTLSGSLVNVLNAVSNTVNSLTNGALVPLINTISGALTSAARAIADIFTGVVKAALEGVRDIISSVGDGFIKMGNAIRIALSGVSGVLSSFADLVHSIADAVVAVVALANGRSINYGPGYAHLFSEGGKVEGPGTSTSDSIPAMLSDGEYVLRTAAAEAIGYDTLDMLNSGRKAWSGDIMAKTSEDFEMSSPSKNGITVYMTNQINNKLDAQEIGNIMMQSIRRAA